MVETSLIIGNAPVSWGVYTSEPRLGENPPYGVVMDGIAQAGYAATELGPYGYYPTAAPALGQELARRGLQLASSYVALPLDQPDAVVQRLPLLDQVCALLHAFRVPYVMVAADATPAREAIAGSVAADGSDSWTAAEWARVEESLQAVTEVVRRYAGLRIAFHHEASSPVETPDEIERLLTVADPELVGLCLDTGHAVYGGGDAAELARRHARRVWYVHLKDVWPDKLAHVRRERLPAPQAWAMGIFAELGQGCVNVPRVVEQLLRNSYKGLIIVEQDIVATGSDRSQALASAMASRAYLRREFGW
ncbi:MAG: TIM barrel protein [Caldilineaceae bacterium]|nr:TIM barrel protein [Caldilineaceae bacterium]